MKVIHFGKRSGDGSALLTDARSYLKDHGLNVETELVDIQRTRDDGVAHHVQSNVPARHVAQHEVAVFGRGG